MQTSERLGRQAIADRLAYCWDVKQLINIIVAVLIRHPACIW